MAAVVALAGQAPLVAWAVWTGSVVFFTGPHYVEKLKAYGANNAVNLAAAVQEANTSSETTSTTTTTIANILEAASAIVDSAVTSVSSAVKSANVVPAVHQANTGPETTSTTTSTLAKSIEAVHNTSSETATPLTGAKAFAEAVESVITSSNATTAPTNSSKPVYNSISSRLKYPTTFLSENINADQLYWFRGLAAVMAPFLIIGLAVRASRYYTVPAKRRGNSVRFYWFFSGIWAECCACLAGYLSLGTLVTCLTWSMMAAPLVLPPHGLTAIWEMLVLSPAVWTWNHGLIPIWEMLIVSPAVWIWNHVRSVINTLYEVIEWQSREFCALSVVFLLNTALPWILGYNTGYLDYLVPKKWNDYSSEFKGKVHPITIGSYEFGHRAYNISEWADEKTTFHGYPARRSLAHILPVLALYNALRYYGPGPSRKLSALAVFATILEYTVYWSQWTTYFGFRWLDVFAVLSMLGSRVAWNAREQLDAALVVEHTQAPRAWIAAVWHLIQDAGVLSWKYMCGTAVAARNMIWNPLVAVWHRVRDFLVDAGLLVRFGFAYVVFLFCVVCFDTFSPEAFARTGTWMEQGFPRLIEVMNTIWFYLFFWPVEQVSKGKGFIRGIWQDPFMWPGQLLSNATNFTAGLHHPWVRNSTIPKPSTDHSMHSAAVESAANATQSLLDHEKQVQALSAFMDYRWFTRGFAVIACASIPVLVYIKHTRAKSFLYRAFVAVLLTVGTLFGTSWLLWMNNGDIYPLDVVIGIATVAAWMWVDYDWEQVQHKREGIAAFGDHVFQQACVWANECEVITWLKDRYVIPAFELYVLPAWNLFKPVLGFIVQAKEDPNVFFNLIYHALGLGQDGGDQDKNLDGRTTPDTTKDRRSSDEAPQDEAPQESAPQESTPQESTPQDDTPQDTTAPPHVLQPEENTSSSDTTDSEPRQPTPPPQEQPEGEKKQEEEDKQKQEEDDRKKKAEEDQKKKEQENRKTQEERTGRFWRVWFPRTAD